MTIKIHLHGERLQSLLLTSHSVVFGYEIGEDQRYTFQMSLNIHQPCSKITLQVKVLMHKTVLFLDTKLVKSNNIYT